MNGLFNALNGLFTALNGLFTALNGLFTALNGLFTALNGLFNAMNGLYRHPQMANCPIFGHFSAYFSPILPLSSYKIGGRGDATPASSYPHIPCKIPPYGL